MVAVLLLTTACANHNLDLSQLDEFSRQQLRQTEVLKITDDVTTAVMAAYHNNNLNRDMTIRILTINKQVRDVVKAFPPDWPSRVAVIVVNAKQSLTVEEHAKLDPWLNLLGGVQ